MKDYFLYDKARDQVFCFSNGDIVFYGSYYEASEDCYEYEEVLTYDKLPKKWQETIKEQLQ